MNAPIGNWRIYPSLTHAVQAGLEFVAARPADKRVLWVDGANRFDPYVILKLTKNPVQTKQILQRVFISRPFTIHQLRRLLDTDLLEAARRQNSATVMIVGASAMFLDENVDENERKYTWKKIVDQIDRLHAHGLNPLVLDYENEYTKLAGEWTYG